MTAAGTLVGRRAAKIRQPGYCEECGLGGSCRRMPVEKVQQSVPAGTVLAVEPPARSRPATSEPPPVPAEDPVEYPSGDGLPISTNSDHLEWMVRCYRTLDHRFRGRRDLFVGVDMLIYYERANNKARVAPDVFVSFGVPPRERPSYFVWLEGKPPDVVWEFGAPLTINGDAAQKKETYRRMGVREYWLADPVGGVYEPRVQGFELADGVYEPMPWEAGPDGLVAVWSPVLQLELRFAEGRLGFWDRETARYLELPEEESERLMLEERRGWLEERRARQRIEREIEEVRRARKALEERIAKFEAESRSTRDPR